MEPAPMLRPALATSPPALAAAAARPDMMSMTKRDLTPTAGAKTAAFAAEMRKLARKSGDDSRGRLIFAMDATASRQPSWDQACEVQAGMFLEADRLGGLDVQLVFYRGRGECRAGRWVSAPADLVRLMRAVECRAGRTQIIRVLRHAASETERTRVHALVLVGDACEEPVDELADLAGRLGLLGVRAFLFHEGADRTAHAAFGEIARLTGGAVCRFDRGAAAQLRTLLAAVAVYTSGGLRALRDHAGSAGPEVRHLVHQLR